MDQNHDLQKNTDLDQRNFGTDLCPQICNNFTVVGSNKMLIL